MEESLKQRLVGALVLLMLAIIFLPLILDGRDDDHHEAVYRAPQEPVIHITHKGSSEVEERIEAAKEKLIADRTFEPSEAVGASETSGKKEAELSVAEEVAPPKVVKQQSVSAAEQSKIDHTRTQFAKEVIAAKAVVKEPVKSKMPLADAWTVQVAAFSKLANAKTLQSRLIAKSYMAYIRPGGTSSKPLHRVFVGPELRKNRARIIQQALKKEFKLAGMIKAYHP